MPSRSHGNLLLACAAAWITAATAAFSGHVWYRDRDGNTNGLENATWTQLQTAITSAQSGSATTGLVKISGDITRTNAAWAQLSVSAGGVVTISGGWNWPGSEAEPTTQSGRSIAHANSAGLGSNVRVFNIASSDVTLQNLEIAGGYAADASRGGGILSSGSRLILEDVRINGNSTVCDYQQGGAGIRINGGSGHRVSRSEITNNVALTGGSRAWGGGLHLDGVASMIIEESSISGNRANDSYYEACGAGMVLANGSKAFLANCRILNNRCNEGGSAIYCILGSATLFGTLISGNGHQTDPEGTPVTTVYGCCLDEATGIVLVNSTVASNYHGSVAARGAHDYMGWQQHTLNAVNSIIEGGSVSLGNYTYAGGYFTYCHMRLQGSTLRLTSANPYVYADFEPGTDTTHWHSTNTLVNALATLDCQSQYRFHSLDASGAMTQDLEQNIEGDPGFIGWPNLHSRPPLSLADSSVCKESGLLRSGSGFLYVDVNANGAYNALVDVIVAGTPPGGSHYVYTKDIAGNPRLKGRTIDRGCYEWQPGKGTVVMLK